MMVKFTDLLDEYLAERDRQNSDYYDDRYIQGRYDGLRQMADLRDEMNAFFEEEETKDGD